MSVRTFRAMVHRTGSHWTAAIPELRMTVDAERLSDVEPIAAQAIGNALDMNPDRVVVDVQLTRYGS